MSIGERSPGAARSHEGGPQTISITDPKRTAITARPVYPRRMEVEGFEHILKASTVLGDIVKDLFSLPGAAQTRAITAREELGEKDHGDDLLCGCWASASAATAILELGGRHGEAMLALADGHPGFAPSASVLARASFESLLRVCWLLSPAAAVDREQRWLALSREEARFFKDAKQIDEQEYAERLTEFDAIAAAIGGEPVAGTPSVKSLADEHCKFAGAYDLLYRFTSQATHASLVGSGTFAMDARQEWYKVGGEGEWIEAEFWGAPFAAFWEGANAALPIYRDLLAPGHPLPSLDRGAEFFAAMRLVPANYQAKKAADMRAKKDGPPVSQFTPNRAQRRAAERAKRTK